MDDRRFDELTQTLAADASRRVFTFALGGALGALFGWDIEHGAAKKRRKKKKKKPAGCPVNCAGRNCGDPDGCGGRCTSQQGCPAGEFCDEGDCVPEECTSACTDKNRICVGGDCVCRSGTKECPNGLGHCHECCEDGGGGTHDDECVGHPSGRYCGDFDNDQVLECGCLPGQLNCGDGQCVECCTHAQCAQKYADDHRICVGGGCLCDEANGWPQCQAGAWRGHCRHVDDDREACGPNCVTCSTSPDLNQVCRGGKCCLPSGRQCGNHPQNCCSPLSCALNNEATAFVCR